tara:strand:+ start:123 stop:530 length:408 start_codon:yes stop_codon:yes gene_type:complete
MGLQRTKLLDIKNITGPSSPVGIFTAGNTVTAAGVAGTTYVRSIVTHNSSGINTAGCSIYIAPNGVTASSATADHRVSRVDINPNETYFFEYNYPLVLTSGDQIAVDVVHPSASSVGGIATGTQMNIQIIGDTDI